MRERPVLDLEELSPYTHSHEGPLWWGFVGLIAIEAAVFAILITSYFYLSMGHAEWPPGGIEEPKLLLPTLNTVILVLSSGAMVFADKRIKKDDKRGLAIGLAVGIVLATVFQILKAIEYAKEDVHWDTNAYGSILWALIVFHSAHVTAVILKTVVVDILAWRGYFTRERMLGVTVNGLYWHFVVAVWIPLYLVIYWSPRLL